MQNDPIRAEKFSSSDATENLVEMPLLRLPEYIRGLFIKRRPRSRARYRDGRSSADSTESRWFLVSEKKRKPRGLSRGRGRSLKCSAATPFDLRAHRLVSSSSYSFTGRYTLQYV